MSSASETINVGVVGLGANTRLRHVPGLLACDNVKIAGVCNRRPESTAAAAAEYDIPKSYDDWQKLVADPAIDAVVIGTWPYLHCEVTMAALAAGKHVLCEARMARDLGEAHRMLQASQAHEQLTAQIVPSPFGLVVQQTMLDLISEGFLGTLREAVILGTNDAVADPDAPLHWRQSSEYSGLNMLMMGILHETLIRWIDSPRRVMSQTRTFTPTRLDPETGQPGLVETPDSVHVLSQLPGDAMALYHLSGAIHFGPGIQIHLYGTDGTIKFVAGPEEKLFAARRGEAELRSVEILPDKAGGWRVEAEFIDAIRGSGPLEFTRFETGVRYMEFTEAVARSAQTGVAIDLPLQL